MAAWEAIRRFVADLPMLTENKPTLSAEGDELRDAFIVVGDGSSPRTAALLSFLAPGWWSVSIDPQLRCDSMEDTVFYDASQRVDPEILDKWSQVDRLVIVRDYIQRVRIRCRRAVVVMLHAHVSVDDAVAAVDADELIGVVTVPCCNFHAAQSTLSGQLPTLVYRDMGLLSLQREVRIWSKYATKGLHLAEQYRVQAIAEDMRLFPSDYPTVSPTELQQCFAASNKKTLRKDPAADEAAPAGSDAAVTFADLLEREGIASPQLLTPHASKRAMDQSHALPTMVVADRAAKPSNGSPPTDVSPESTTPSPHKLSAKHERAPAFINWAGVEVLAHPTTSSAVSAATASRGAQDVLDEYVNQYERSLRGAAGTSSATDAAAPEARVSPASGSKKAKQASGGKRQVHGTGYNEFQHATKATKDAMLWGTLKRPDPSSVTEADSGEPTGPEHVGQSVTTQAVEDLSLLRMHGGFLPPFCQLLQRLCPGLPSAVVFGPGTCVDGLQVQETATAIANTLISAGAPKDSSKPSKTRVLLFDTYLWIGRWMSVGGVDETIAGDVALHLMMHPSSPSTLVVDVGHADVLARRLSKQTAKDVVTHLAESMDAVLQRVDGTFLSLSGRTFLAKSAYFAHAGVSWSVTRVPLKPAAGATSGAKQQSRTRDAGGDSGATSRVFAYLCRCRTVSATVGSSPFSLPGCAVSMSNESPAASRGLSWQRGATQWVNQFIVNKGTTNHAATLEDAVSACRKELEAGATPCTAATTDTPLLPPTMSASDTAELQNRLDVLVRRLTHVTDVPDALMTRDQLVMGIQSTARLLARLLQSVRMFTLLGNDPTCAGLLAAQCSEEKGGMQWPLQTQFAASSFFSSILALGAKSGDGSGEQGSTAAIDRALLVWLEAASGDDAADGLTRLFRLRQLTARAYEQAVLTSQRAPTLPRLTTGVVRDPARSCFWGPDDPLLHRQLDQTRFIAGQPWAVCPSQLRYDWAIHYCTSVLNGEVPTVPPSEQPVFLLGRVAASRTFKSMTFYDILPWQARGVVRVDEAMVGLPSRAKYINALKDIIHRDYQVSTPGAADDVAETRHAIPAGTSDAIQAELKKSGLDPNLMPLQAIVYHDTWGVTESFRMFAAHWKVGDVLLMLGRRCPSQLGEPLLECVDALLMMDGAMASTAVRWIQPC